MFYLLLICGGAVALDQIVKALVVANIPLGGTAKLIPGIIRLTYVRNSGAAFSMLEGQRGFFLVLTAVFLVGVVYCVVKKVFPRAYFPLIALITGGAIGNLIDRVVHGYVVDMFELEFMDFAVFNVADLFLTFGAAILVIYALFFDKSTKQEGKSDDRSV